jgi:hypothetical protein
MAKATDKDQKLDRVEMLAAVLTEIHLGIAMARAKGVVCGSPIGVRTDGEAC